MSTIAVWTPHDLVLSLAIPIGLASRRGTAIVIDLDPSGPPIPGGGDLASLVERGPTESELAPSKVGIAVLGNGGIEVSDASEVISAIAHRWPNVVLRCAPHSPPGRGVVSVVPVLPEPFTLVAEGKVAYQRTSLGGDPETGAIVLPVPRPAVIRSLLSGRIPPVRDRWLRALDAVWSLS
ncbi:MAG: hypothetical protein M3132_06095 [Actinomycetia bacterium]|nr:hypothetical protein [Actinomycetes bacterium]